MITSLVVAMDSNRLIGDGEKMPWHMPADLSYFKALTMGKPIIMGRKTYDSIGRPLPGRKNIVLTRERNFTMPGCIVVHSLADALAVNTNADEVMIIGGAQVYMASIDMANKLYVTEIKHVFEGSRYFPDIDLHQWQEIDRQTHKADADNPYDYAFVKYSRR